MTYPPQQPGSGGWDQQQAGDGATGTPQEPVWHSNEQITWDQPSGQSGPQQFPPQPFPQLPSQPLPQHQAPQQDFAPPQWAGEFGQGSWIREPHGFGEVVAPEPKKSRTPWILGAAGALVVAGGAAAGLFFFLGTGPGNPVSAAQDLISKVNANDFDAVRGELCEANRPQLEHAIGQLQGGRYDIQVGKVTETGDKAAVQLTGSYSLRGGSPQPVAQTMGLTVENGQWKLCELTP